MTVTSSDRFPTTGNYEFGNWKNGNVHVLKYEDEDASGTGPDANENGIVGWKIYVFKKTGTNPVVFTQVDAVPNTTGTQAFSTGTGGLLTMSLPPGDYRICEELQTDWTQGEAPGTASCAEAAVGVSGLATNGVDVTVTSSDRFPTTRR